MTDDTIDFRKVQQFCGHAEEIAHNSPEMAEYIREAARWIARKHEAARRGGQARSPAKTRAVRLNARKGGRPRKIEE